jgi:YVTN family beta-propeller protein
MTHQKKFRSLVVRFVLVGIAVVLPQGSAIGQGSGLPPTNPSPPAESSDRARHGQLAEIYGKLPLSFEANQGQVDGKVSFLSRGSGYTLFLTPTVNLAGTAVYVANTGGNTVSVINTGTNTVTATVTVGSHPVAFGLFITPH